MSIDEMHSEESVPTQAVGEIHPYKRKLRQILLLATIVLCVTAIGGYGLNWFWTGYPGNTLWDWLHLLLIPIGIAAATLFFSSERTWRREWTIALVGLGLLLLIVAIGGYALHWTWAGFQGNTLWDWFRLIFQPVGLASLSIFFGTKRAWKRTWGIALSVALLLLLITIIGGYVFHWTWTGFQGNTLWDWINMFLLPVTLAVTEISFKGYERAWVSVLVGICIILLITIVGGYVFHWTWTGFQGNKLWNWLELLLLPIALSIVQPLFDTYPQEGRAVAIVAFVFLLVTLFGSYVLHWTWTGFQGNTLWDWLTLLLLPIGLAVARIIFKPAPKPALSTEELQVAVTLNDELPLSPKPAPPTFRERKGLVAITLAAILLILVGSGVGTLTFAHAQTSTVPLNNDIHGSLSFFSSLHPLHHGRVGINDGVQLQLQHVPDPSMGSQYYAWLQNDQGTPVSIALGMVTPDHGSFSLTYRDPQYRDLLATTSHLLITEEATNIVPNNPTPDKGRWRYEAALSYLDHMRLLLSDVPDLTHNGLFGGVAVGFMNNIEQVEHESNTAKNQGSVHFMRQSVANVISYLAGKCATSDLSQAGGPIVSEANIVHASSISLLDCDDTRLSGAPGYLTDMQNQLNDIAQSSGVTPAQAKQAMQIKAELDVYKTWLGQIHSDALQLIKLDHNHLAGAQTLRADMSTQADYLVHGGVDHVTNTPVPGVQQLVNSITQLTKMDIVTYRT